MLEESYDLEEISKDFDKITEILTKHNMIIAKAELTYRMNRNMALIEEEEDQKVAVYSHYQNEATNALFFMKETVQPTLQKYIDLYINNFSKKADEDIDALLEDD